MTTFLLSLYTFYIIHYASYTRITNKVKLLESALLCENNIPYNPLAACQFYKYLFNRKNSIELFYP